jgi:hypothetical protein
MERHWVYSGHYPRIFVAPKNAQNAETKCWLGAVPILLLAISASTMAKIHGLSSKSIDFVLAFPQADLEIPVFMELPLGFDAPDSQSRKYFVLQLNKSLYGLKQTGYNWFTKLSNRLKDCGFVPSSVYPCVFFGQGCIALTYVDNCIIVDDSMQQINALIQLLQR